MCTEDDAFLFKSGRFMHGFVVLYPHHPPIVTPPDPLAPDCRLAKEGEKKQKTLKRAQTVCFHWSRAQSLSYYKPV